MKNQKGVTISGMLMVCMVLVLVLILAFKLVPFYLEYNTIKKNFQGMAADPALQKATLNEMRRSWDARTSIDNVKSISPQDIDYSRDATGWTISADYSVKVPLLHSVNLCLDFHPTSN
jgi:hypothetical protein